MTAGIVGYGCYVPWLRITPQEIAKVWGKDGDSISKGMNIKEKAIGSFDEDAATISVEASRKAINDFEITPSEIGAIYVGSESHPYAVKPTASILGEALGAGPDLMAADLEFACKAGTAGIQIALGLVKSKMIKYGLAVGADTAQGRPGDALEFTAGSGGAAFIVGDKQEEVIAEINHTASFTTDTPDFWRRQHAEFPEHAGRFTGKPAYFKHVLNATKKLMNEMKTTPDDYDFAVFHQPNGKFPLLAAKQLGFDLKKIEQGLLTPFIGNTYSGSAMVGFCSVLDKAMPGDRILVTSYGSGSGSDSFDLTITENIKKRRAKVSVFEMIKHKKNIDYAEYAKHRRKIKTL